MSSRRWRIKLTKEREDDWEPSFFRRFLRASLHGVLWAGLAYALADRFTLYREFVLWSTVVPTIWLSSTLLVFACENAHPNASMFHLRAFFSGLVWNVGAYTVCFISLHVAATWQPYHAGWFYGAYFAFFTVMLAICVMTYGWWVFSALFIWHVPLPTIVHGEDIGSESKSHRGAKLGTHASASKAASTGSNGKGRPVLLDWGGIEFPELSLDKHFLVAGVTGSGKTLTLRLLMRSVLPQVRPGSGWRAIIFDPKNEALGQCRDAGADRGLVRLLNPFDIRSSPWAVAKDIDIAPRAKQLARTLIPKVSRNDPFWDDAAADILEGAIVGFQAKRPGEWTFRDIVLATMSVDDLREVLRWDEDENRERLARYFDSGRLTQSILINLTVHLARYRIIAACWHNAKHEPLSLRDWVKAEQVLILGHSSEFSEVIGPTNRVLFRRAAELLLDESDPENESRSWIFLDELATAGKLDQLTDLMEKGRTYGVRLVLGFQDISSLRRIYGNEEAESITAQVANKAILKQRGPVSAEWAQSLFGEEEFIEEMESGSMSTGGVSRGWGRQRTRRPVVLGGQFLDLPEANKALGRGVTGFFQVQQARSYRHEIPSELISKKLAALGENREPNFERRPPEHYRLSPWTPGERMALNLPPQKPAAPPMPGEDEGARPRLRDEDLGLGEPIDD